MPASPPDSRRCARRRKPKKDEDEAARAKNGKDESERNADDAEKRRRLRTKERGDQDEESTDYASEFSFSPARLAVSGCISTSSPHAKFTRTPKEGYPPLEVTFDASESSSPNGAIVSYEWDFGDDEDGSGVTVEHTYNRERNVRRHPRRHRFHCASAARTDEVQALSLAPVATFTVDHYYVAVDETVWFDASTPTTRRRDRRVPVGLRGRDQRRGRRRQPRIHDRQRHRLDAADHPHGRR